MKKILGVPLVMVVIGLVVIGGAMAALVNYLSSPVTADATVDSPLELKIAPKTGGTWEDSLSLGTVYGGDEVEFRIREVNRANTEITADLVITVSEAGIANVCDELTVEFREQGNVGYTTMPCTPANNNLEFRFDGTVVPAGQDAVYEVRATLAQNAKGTYSATVQHMNPTS